MIFNSVEFLAFFLLFLVAYWNFTKHQNIVLLIGSYIFYAWWDWRFLFLIIASTLVNYLLGIYIYKAKTERLKTFYLFLGMLQGLGCLFFFKYYNFFVTSLNQAFSFGGLSTNLQLLKIILPLGISFYTFRTLSYLLDINKGKYEPTTNWLVFFSYVSFFPSLLSGPIDRANLLVPQLEKSREFNAGQFTDGLRQILWGLFKKIVIADNCAGLTNHIFEHYQNLSGSTLVVGAFFYYIQLYADFSGYSDMAMGVAKLLGLKITRNFDYPFFAQSISEYWRKWHISLTSWLTEYVFTPLSIAFRDYGKYGLFLAILLNFITVGIWHGANWTYVVFGIIHGLLFVPSIVDGTMNKRRKMLKGQQLPSLLELKNMVVTFTLVMFTEIFFRADNVSQAFGFIHRIFSVTLFTRPELAMSNTAKFSLLFIPVLFSAEWVQRNEEHGLKIERVKSKGLRLLIYYVLIFAIILLGAFSNKAFIYFQF